MRGISRTRQLVDALFISVKAHKDSSRNCASTPYMFRLSVKENAKFYTAVLKQKMV